MKSRKEKVKNDLYYLWAFYKYFLIAGLIVLALVIYLLTVKFTEKDTALSVMLVDCHTEVSEEQMAEDFETAAGIDLNREKVEVQNSLMFNESNSGSYTMSCLSKFMADIGNAALDVCGMLETDFLKYDASDTWLDLRTCLDEETLKELEDYLVTAEDGRVIGVYADELPGMVSYSCYAQEDTQGILGIAYNSPHVELAVEYIQYLAKK